MKFNKLAIVGAMALGLSANAFADHNYETSIVIGPTFSTHNFDAAALADLAQSGNSPGMGVGYSFGSFLGFDFNDATGMEFGVLFNKRTTTFANATEVYSSTVLNIPVLFRLSPFSELHGLKFELGPYIGLLNSGSLTRGNRTLATTSNEDMMDLGAVGGITYIAPVNEKVGLRMSALYYYGFTDATSSIATINNRGLDVYLGVTLYN